MASERKGPGDGVLDAGLAEQQRNFTRYNARGTTTSISTKRAHLFHD